MSSDVIPPQPPFAHDPHHRTSHQTLHHHLQKSARLPMHGPLSAPVSGGHRQLNNNNNNNNSNNNNQPSFDEETTGSHPEIQTFLTSTGLNSGVVNNSGVNINSVTAHSVTESFFSESSTCAIPVPSEPLCAPADGSCNQDSLSQVRYVNEDNSLSNTCNKFAVSESVSPSHENSVALSSHNFENFSDKTEAPQRLVELFSGSGAATVAPGIPGTPDSTPSEQPSSASSFSRNQQPYADLIEHSPITLKEQHAAYPLIGDTAYNCSTNETTAGNCENGNTERQNTPSSLLNDTLPEERSASNSTGSSWFGLAPESQITVPSTEVPPSYPCSLQAANTALHLSQHGYYDADLGMVQRLSPSFSGAAMLDQDRLQRLLGVNGFAASNILSQNSLHMDQYTADHRDAPLIHTQSLDGHLPYALPHQYHASSSNVQNRPTPTAPFDYNYMLHCFGPTERVPTFLSNEMDVPISSYSPHSNTNCRLSILDNRSDPGTLSSSLPATATIHSTEKVSCDSKKNVSSGLMVKGELTTSALQTSYSSDSEKPLQPPLSDLSTREEPSAPKKQTLQVDFLEKSPTPSIYYPSPAPVSVHTPQRFQQTTEATPPLSFASGEFAKSRASVESGNGSLHSEPAHSQLLTQGGNVTGDIASGTTETAWTSSVYSCVTTGSTEASHSPASHNGFLNRQYLSPNKTVPIESSVSSVRLASITPDSSDANTDLTAQTSCKPLLNDELSKSSLSCSSSLPQAEARDTSQPNSFLSFPSDVQYFLTRNVIDQYISSSSGSPSFERAGIFQSNPVTCAFSASTGAISNDSASNTALSYFRFPHSGPAKRHQQEQSGSSGSVSTALFSAGTLPSLSSSNFSGSEFSTYETAAIRAGASSLSTPATNYLTDLQSEAAVKTEHSRFLAQNNVLRFGSGEFLERLPVNTQLVLGSSSINHRGTEHLSDKSEVESFSRHLAPEKEQSSVSSSFVVQQLSGSHSTVLPHYDRENDAEGSRGDLPQSSSGQAMAPDARTRLPPQKQRRPRTTPHQSTGEISVLGALLQRLFQIQQCQSTGEIASRGPTRSQRKNDTIASAIDQVSPSNLLNLLKDLIVLQTAQPSSPTSSSSSGVEGKRRDGMEPASSDNVSHVLLTNLDVEAMSTQLFHISGITDRDFLRSVAVWCQRNLPTNQSSSNEFRSLGLADASATSSISAQSLPRNPQKSYHVLGAGCETSSTLPAHLSNEFQKQESSVSLLADSTSDCTSAGQQNTIDDDGLLEFSHLPQSYPEALLPMLGSIIETLVEKQQVLQQALAAQVELQANTLMALVRMQCAITSKFSAPSTVPCCNREEHHHSLISSNDEQLESISGRRKRARLHAQATAESFLSGSAEFTKETQVSQYLQNVQSSIATMPPDDTSGAYHSTNSAVECCEEPALATSCDLLGLPLAASWVDDVDKLKESQPSPRNNFMERRAADSAEDISLRCEILPSAADTCSDVVPVNHKMTTAPGIEIEKSNNSPEQQSTTTHKLSGVSFSITTSPVAEPASHSDYSVKEYCQTQGAASLSDDVGGKIEKHLSATVKLINGQTKGFGFGREKIHESGTDKTNPSLAFRPNQKRSENEILETDISCSIETKRLSPGGSSDVKQNDRIGDYEGATACAPQENGTSSLPDKITNYRAQCLLQLRALASVTPQWGEYCDSYGWHCRRLENVIEFSDESLQTSNHSILLPSVVEVITHRTEEYLKLFLDDSSQYDKAPLPLHTHSPRVSNDCGSCLSGTSLVSQEVSSFVATKRSVYNDLSQAQNTDSDIPVSIMFTTAASHSDSCHPFSRLQHNFTLRVNQAAELIPVWLNRLDQLRASYDLLFQPLFALPCLLQATAFSHSVSNLTPAFVKQSQQLQSNFIQPWKRYFTKPQSNFAQKRPRMERSNSDRSEGENRTQEEVDNEHQDTESSRTQCHGSPRKCESATITPESSAQNESNDPRFKTRNRASSLYRMRAPKNRQCHCPGSDTSLSSSGMLKQPADDKMTRSQSKRDGKETIHSLSSRLDTAADSPLSDESTQCGDKVRASMSSPSYSATPVDTTTDSPTNSDQDTDTHRKLDPMGSSGEENGAVKKLCSSTEFREPVGATDPDITQLATLSPVLGDLAKDSVARTTGRKMMMMVCTARPSVSVLTPVTSSCDDEDASSRSSLVCRCPSSLSTHQEDQISNLPQVARVPPVLPSATVQQRNFVVAHYQNDLANAAEPFHTPRNSDHLARSSSNTHSNALEHPLFLSASNLPSTESSSITSSYLYDPHAFHPALSSESPAHLLMNGVPSLRIGVAETSDGSTSGRAPLGALHRPSSSSLLPSSTSAAADVDLAYRSSLIPGPFAFNPDNPAASIPGVVWSAHEDAWIALLHDLPSVDISHPPFRRFLSSEYGSDAARLLAIQCRQEAERQLVRIPTHSGIVSAGTMLDKLVSMSNNSFVTVNGPVGSSIDERRQGHPCFNQAATTLPYTRSKEGSMVSGTPPTTKVPSETANCTTMGGGDVNTTAAAPATAPPSTSWTAPAAAKDASLSSSQVPTPPKSEVPGVYWYRNRNGWVAQWFENGKNKHKFFAASAFGIEGAKQKAIAYRLMKLEEKRLKGW